MVTVARKPTGVNWVQEVKIGAARGFGAKHYRLIVGMAVLRRALPPLLAFGAIALVGYLLFGVRGQAITVGFAAAALAVVVAAGAWVWRRWSWVVLDYVALPRPVAVGLAFLVVLAVGGGALAFWVA